MSGFLGTFLSFLVWLCIILAFSAAFSNKNRKRSVSSDGHVVSKQEDLTCEGKEGHHHPAPSAEDVANYGARYIVHNDPETGYVVLNGVKRRISECKDL
ncbi:MAG: hypothetical protein IJ225_07375 [Solobacterium sp.]|nr:hypothetical protein [Solobacterium sp.]